MKKILASILALSMIFCMSYSEIPRIFNSVPAEAVAPLLTGTLENGLKYEVYIANISIVGVEDESIEFIEIPDKIEGKPVVWLTKEAFRNCSNLKEIVFPNTLKFIYEGGLEYTPWYTEQPDGVIYAGNMAYKYKGEMPENAVIEIKDGTEKILTEAFKGQKNLKEVKFPDSLKNIGEDAFIECTGLTEITFPENISIIDEYAFCRCSNLEKAVVPDSIKTLGMGVFSGCINLKEVKLPDNIQQIKHGTFYDCKSLKEIAIPDSVTFIGKVAFLNSGLTQIIIPESVETIEYAAVGCYEYYNDYKTAKGFKIYGIKGSAAEEYAAENGFEFIEWDGTPIDKLPPNTDIVTEETTTSPKYTEETTVKETLNLPEATLKGDATGDGVVDVRDVAAISMYLIKMKELTEQELANADVTKDNIVNINDLTQLKRFLINDISEL